MPHPPYASPTKRVLFQQRPISLDVEVMASSASKQGGPQIPFPTSESYPLLGRYSSPLPRDSTLPKNLSPIKYCPASTVFTLPPPNIPLPPIPTQYRHSSPKLPLEDWPKTRKRRGVLFDTTEMNVNGSATPTKEEYSKITLKFAVPSPEQSNSSTPVRKSSIVYSSPNFSTSSANIALLNNMHNENGFSREVKIINYRQSPLRKVYQHSASAQTSRANLVDESDSDSSSEDSVEADAEINYLRLLEQINRRPLRESENENGGEMNGSLTLQRARTRSLFSPRSKPLSPTRANRRTSVPHIPSLPTLPEYIDATNPEATPSQGDQSYEKSTEADMLRDEVFWNDFRRMVEASDGGIYLAMCGLGPIVFNASLDICTATDCPLEDRFSV